MNITKIKYKKSEVEKIEQTERTKTIKLKPSKIDLERLEKLSKFLKKENYIKDEKTGLRIYKSLDIDLESGHERLYVFYYVTFQEFSCVGSSTLSELEKLGFSLLNIVFYNHEIAFEYKEVETK